MGEISSVLKEPLTILEQAKFLIDSHDHKPHETEEALGLIVNHSVFFESVYVLDTKKQIVNLGLPKNSSLLRDNLMGMDMGGMDIFQDQTPIQGPRWSQTYLSPLTGHKSLDLSLPLFKDMILAASFSIEHIQKTLTELTQNSHLIIFIADDRGNLIFHPKESLVREHMNFSHILPLEKAIKGIFGTFSFSMENQEFIGSTANIPELNWHLVVAQTKSQAKLSLNRLRTYFGIALMVSLLLVVMLAMDTGQALLSPLTLFQEKVIELGQGRYKTPIPTQPHIELEALAASSEKWPRTSEPGNGICRSVKINFGPSLKMPPWQ